MYEETLRITSADHSPFTCDYRKWNTARVPVAILEGRMTESGNAAATEVLVQWQNHSREDATWELYHELKLRFPEIVNF